MFEIPIVKEEDEEALENLHRMIRPFILRRLKSDVLKELPVKLEKVVYSAPEGKQKELYRAAALKLRQSLEEDEKTAETSGKFQILAELRDSGSFAVIRPSVSNGITVSRPSLRPASPFFSLLQNQAIKSFYSPSLPRCWEL